MNVWLKSTILTLDWDPLHVIKTFVISFIPVVSSIELYEKNAEIESNPNWTEKSMTIE
jgi:hypothetical protein